jgi:hypothetical protein
MKDKPTDEKPHAVGSFTIPIDKDVLSQEDLENDVNTVSPSNEPHAPLETPDGKNNGAEPAAFKNQRKSQT